MLEIVVPEEPRRGGYVLIAVLSIYPHQTEKNDVNISININLIYSTARLN